MYVHIYITDSIISTVIFNERLSMDNHDWLGFLVIKKSSIIRNAYMRH